MRRAKNGVSAGSNMGTRKIHRTCCIDAPIETVWELLTRIDGYALWNPFVVDVTSAGSGTDVGSMLELTVQWHDGGQARSSEQVIAVQPPLQQGDALKARWVYSYRGWVSTLGMVRSVRTQSLSQQVGGPTEYISEICLSGWALWGAPLAKIQRGLQAQADALKAHAQAQAQLDQGPA